MKHRRRDWCTAVLSAMTLAASAFAGDVVWIRDDGAGPGTGNGLFFFTGNWQGFFPPIGESDVVIISAVNGGTATIHPTAPSATFAAIQLGRTGNESGHILIDAAYTGVMSINPSDAHTSSHIGDGGQQLSTLIMNGGTIHFGNLLGTDFSIADDWEIGEFGMGRMEMHNNSVFRIHDDLKIAAGTNGNGTFIMDGDTILTVGGGISVTEGGSGARGTFTIGGNAQVVSGNSRGIGDPLGTSDAGYFRLSEDRTAVAEVTFKDNAVVSVRSLIHRVGTSNLTVRDNAQFRIFNTFTPEGGTENGAGSSQDFHNRIGSKVNAFMTLTIRDHAVMSIDSVAGLHVGGDRDLDADGAGTGTVIVQDFGSLIMKQNLILANSFSPQGRGTLLVRGPNATVDIAGAFRMNPPGNDAIATLQTVITAPTHTTIHVGGDAEITHGVLRVALAGYTPVWGDQYTLIDAGNLIGRFEALNFTSAPLTGGLIWRVLYDDHVVTLDVAVPGDFNHDAVADATDIDLMTAHLAEGGNNALYDINVDHLVNQTDFDLLIGSIHKTVLGDTNLDRKVDIADLAALATWFGSTDAGWAKGDIDGDGVVAINDLAGLATNFGFDNTAGMAIGQATHAVPEPATVTAMLLLAAAARQRGRRLATAALA